MTQPVDEWADKEIVDEWGGKELAATATAAAEPATATTTAAAKPTDTGVRRHPLYRLGSGFLSLLEGPTQVLLNDISSHANKNLPSSQWGPRFSQYLDEEKAKDAAAIGDDFLLHGYDIAGSLASPVNLLSAAKLPALAGKINGFNELPKLLKSISLSVPQSLITAAALPEYNGHSKTESLDTAFDIGLLMPILLGGLGKMAGGVGTLATSVFGGGGNGVATAYEIARQGGPAARAYLEAKGGGVDVQKKVVDDLFKGLGIMDEARSDAFTKGIDDISRFSEPITLEQAQVIKDSFDKASLIGVTGGEEISNEIALTKLKVANVLDEHTELAKQNQFFTEIPSLKFLHDRLRAIRSGLTSQEERASQERVINTVDSAVVELMKKNWPGYGLLSTENANAERVIKDITESIGLREGAGTESVMNKALKSLKSDLKADYIDSLQKYGPAYLLPRIAGVANKPLIPTGQGQVLMQGSIASLLAMNGYPASGLLYAAGQSPKLASGAAYGLGAGARGFNNALGAFGYTPSSFLTRLINETALKKEPKNDRKAYR